MPGQRGVRTTQTLQSWSSSVTEWLKNDCADVAELRHAVTSFSLGPICRPCEIGSVGFSQQIAERAPHCLSGPQQHRCAHTYQPDASLDVVLR